MIPLAHLNLIPAYENMLDCKFTFTIHSEFSIPIAYQAPSGWGACAEGPSQHSTLSENLIESGGVPLKCRYASAPPWKRNTPCSLKNISNRFQC